MTATFCDSCCGQTATEEYQLLDHLLGGALSPSCAKLRLELNTAEGNKAVNGNSPADIDN